MSKSLEALFTEITGQPFPENVKPGKLPPIFFDSGKAMGGSPHPHYIRRGQGPSRMVAESPMRRIINIAERYNTSDNQSFRRVWDGNMCTDNHGRSWTIQELLATSDPLLFEDTVTEEGKAHFKRDLGSVKAALASKKISRLMDCKIRVMGPLGIGDNGSVIGGFYDTPTQSLFMCIEQGLGYTNHYGPFIIHEFGHRFHNLVRGHGPMSDDLEVSDRSPLFTTIDQHIIAMYGVSKRLFHHFFPTPYSRTYWFEFWAELFSFYVCDWPMPPEMKKWTGAMIEEFGKVGGIHG